MKNNPALKGFIISMVAVFFSFAIYFFFLAKKNEYIVDNSSNELFYFKLNNGNEMVISPGQFVKVDVQKGKNNIIVMDENKKICYDSVFQVKKQRGLINIAHQDYFINTQYYGYNLKKDSLLLALGKTDIDGNIYLGAPKQNDKLYLEDFYYNVNEKYDPLIKNISKVESRTKIFRKQDFINYYKEYYKF